MDHKCYICKGSLGEGREYLDSPTFRNIKLMCDKCAKDFKEKKRK